MAKHRSSTKTAGGIMLLILVCFFLSGLTGLIYEILWIRMIVKIIGGAPFAVSIILTIFMGGLGLGSYIAGRTIDRIAEPVKLVRIYGIIELIVGAYALTIPFLLTAYEPIQAFLYNRLFEQFMVYNILTFISCSILLCVPVICMGATLPILCRFYVTRLSHLGTNAGRLYGLNTIGAAVGSFLCGFWFINHFGMTGTLVLAVVINGLIGLVCIIASYKTTVPQSVTDQADAELPQAEKEEFSEKALIAALIIFAISGFCAMAYEVIWTKLLGLIVGPTTYSFTIVLVTFILGLALGSIIFGWLGDKTKKPLWLLVNTQIAAAVFVLAVSQLLGNSQLFFSKLIFTFKDSFTLLNISKTVVLFAFMILPTLFLGATFPLVGKIYTRSISKIGRSIGFAYAINTIGAVLGSFCAGFVIVPLIGKENGLSVVIGIQLVTSLVIAIMIFVRRESLRRVVFLAVPALTGILLCFYLPQWNRSLLSTGKYHRLYIIDSAIKNTSWLDALLNGPEILAKSQTGELIYYGDGIGGFTTVLKRADAFGNISYSMYNSGKADASSHVDMDTQTLLAHFPMLFHQDAKAVMVLGLASGVTTGEILYYPIDNLDVLEISREVAEASKYFIPWNNNVLSHPKTDLIIQDARAHLQLSKQKYDVIISEPSNPWMAGLATLFTRDFFELAKDRLNDNGIFVQWLHCYQIDWLTFALVGRTFAEVFENSILVTTEPSGMGSNFLMVGFNGEDQLVLENAQENLKYLQQSKNVTLPDVKLLYRLIESEDLKKLFGSGFVNTDSRPRLEFTAPKLMYTRDTNIFANLQSGKWLSPQTRNIVQQVTTDIDSQIDFAEYALSLYSPFGAMFDQTAVSDDQKQRFFKLLEDYWSDNEINYAIIEDDQLKSRCRLVQIETMESNIDRMPEKVISYDYLAGLYYQQGLFNKAIPIYFKLLELNPDRAAGIHFNIATAFDWLDKIDQAIKHYNKVLQLTSEYALTIHARLGSIAFDHLEFDKAIDHYTQLLRLEPNSVLAIKSIGDAYFRQGKLQQAIEQYNKTLEIDPAYVKAHYMLGVALANTGEINGAITHLKEAIRLAPQWDDPRNALRQIQKKLKDQS